jgi:hypothetical protein
MARVVQANQVQQKQLRFVLAGIIWILALSIALSRGLH